jgi:hypothetical protein
MTEKRYEGHPVAGRGIPRVTVQDAEGAHPLAHARLIMLGDFAWGVTSAGATALAASLLADYLGSVPSVHDMHTFLRERVLRWAPSQGRSLSTSDLAAFLTAQTHRRAWAQQRSARGARRHGYRLPGRLGPVRCYRNAWRISLAHPHHDFESALGHRGDRLPAVYGPQCGLKPQWLILSMRTERAVLAAGRSG